MSFKLINIFFCLILATQLHSSAGQCVESMEPTNTIYTTTGGRLYPIRFPASPIGCFSYSIKGDRHTFVGLFTNNNSPLTNARLEYSIGGLPGITSIGFKRDNRDINNLGPQAHLKLSSTGFQEFWVSWVRGTYKIGHKGQKAFMTWQDPRPFPVVSVGVETQFGAIANYRVEEPRCPGINM